MQQIVSFLKLIRINNLLIMLATLAFARYCLNDSLLITSVFNLPFLYLILACILTAAGGYIINDYYDVKLDLVNKPKKVVVGNVIPRRWAMLLHLLFSVAAILFGSLINTKVAIVIFICTMLLWLYSVSFKKQFLIGNIIIALMSAFTIFILKIVDQNISVFLILTYSLFAFFISILREIIKDIEDIKGDKNFNCKTLPIVLGIIKTKKVLITTCILFIALIVAALFYISELNQFQKAETLLYYQLYMVIFIIIPLIGIIYLIKKAKVKKDFSQLSLFTKLVMLSGILSMLFLKF